MRPVTNRSTAAPEAGCTVEQYAEVIVVTPAMAKTWLKGTTTNRRISRSRVRRYAKLMATDRFHLNGETIKIDEHGKLLDGQHRCAAIVSHGLPVKMYVAFNVPRSTLITIDMGRPRSLADQLRVAYMYKNTGDLGTIIRFILEWKETGWISHTTFRQVDPDEAHEYILANLDIVDLPKVAANLGTGLVVGLMTRNQCAFLMWLFSRVDPDDAKRFMYNLVNNISEYENDPCLVLRRQLLKMRSDRYGEAKRNIIIGMTIQSWNKWRSRQPAKLFRAPPSAQAWDANTYPKPI